MNNFLTPANTANFKYKLSLEALLKIEIRSLDEYIQWVSNWKIMHRELVRAIHEMRRLKNEAKKSWKGGSASEYWITKKALGRWARRMYELRAEHKANRRQGMYKALEVA